MYIVLAKTFSGESVIQYSHDEFVAKNTFDVFLLDHNLVSVEMYDADLMFSYTDGRSEHEKKLHSEKASEPEEELES